mmetsp:Transcript_19132/g.52711  ORF Transcript_19132/g.52711 Transcript_19132/m.52711 type:complete len:99 (+) Transcript_19132:555-851(+)|eukprot:scaffold102363_cov32-Tisochrysis_lutea.AAC.1
MYGPCEVKLHVLLTTARETNVQREDSFMYRLELRVKRKLAQLIERTKRGVERVACPLQTLQRVVFLADVDVVGALKTFANIDDVLTNVDGGRGGAPAP